MRTTYNSYIETPEGIVIPVMISLPANFDSKKHYPLTVFLHGKGEFTWGWPNMSTMYKQGITKEIKEGKRDNFQSIVVAIQGQSNNGNWWVEQIEYVISVLNGEVTPKAKHRTDTINEFKALEGIKSYNIDKNIDFMVISQGGQGFADWLKRYTKRTVGIVTLVSAYVTLNADDKAFERIKGGVQVYHNSNDGVGKWGSEQLAKKASDVGLQSRKVIYNSSSHDAWTKAFADADLYKFHSEGFVNETPGDVVVNPPVSEPPIVIEPEKPEDFTLKPGIVKFKRSMFSSPSGANIDNIVTAIIEGKEAQINWQNNKPVFIIIDLEGEAVVEKIRVKDGQGVNADPSVFKTDKGEQIGVFYGKQYNMWYDLPTYNFKSRYIIIENVIETKKNFPIGLEIVLK
jgi:hypothetical protein